jgi:hypothetical protein
MSTPSTTMSVTSLTPTLPKRGVPIVQSSNINELFIIPDEYVSTAQLWYLYSEEDNECLGVFKTKEAARKMFLIFANRFFETAPMEAEDYKNTKDPDEEELELILEHMICSIGSTPYFEE